MTHENVTFNTNNTMSSTPSHPLVWQEQMSGGYHEDDEVVMLNIAMLVSTFKYLLFKVKNSVNILSTQRLTLYTTFFC